MAREARNPAHQRILDEVLLLHERLHRVTVALAITEDLLADTFERMAAMPSARSTAQMHEAKRARAAANECRRFASRLETLTPQRGPDQPPPMPRLV